MDCDRILPNLFVGACPRNVDDVDELRREYGVDAVLNLQTDQDFRRLGVDWGVMHERYEDSGIEIRRVPVRDFDEDDLRRRLGECVRVLEQLLDQGRTVYLHCTEGMGRSPAVAVAYLHWTRGRALEEAEMWVRTRRACTPNVDAVRMASEDRRQ